MAMCVSGVALEVVVVSVDALHQFGVNKEAFFANGHLEMPGKSAEPHGAKTLFCR